MADVLAAEGLDDWVVLHGGATAVFVVPSLIAAAILARAIAEVPGVDLSGAVVTLTCDQLTVRLTRGVMRLESSHVDMARRVSEIARDHEAIADRGRVHAVQLTVAAQPEEVDVGFWRAVLGYSRFDDDNAVDPLGHGSTVWMQELDPGKGLRHGMHVDVSVARDHAQEPVAAALAAGGRIVMETLSPPAWTLADHAGNRVCITAWPDGA